MSVEDLPIRRESQAMRRTRIGRRGLEDIRASLSERHIEVLSTVSTHRYVTTRQICRFHFAGRSSESAALRSANRSLGKLRELRALMPLERRIGGVRAGSGSYVWTLGTVGARIMEQESRRTGLSARYREHEPSRTFLEHTLAVTEVSLRLTEAARRSRIVILGIEYEPASWRAYNGPHGALTRLKPDLALVTATDEFEDHWFVEVDMATEPPSRILRTCLTYQAYRRSGEEQRRHGVFPVVVWIVPSLERKRTIETHLARNEAVSPRLFRVITLDELESLIERGAAAGEAGDRQDAPEEFR